MAGRLRYSHSDAAAEPLTPEGIFAVIASARRVVVNQLALAVAVSAALLLLARVTSGPFSVVVAGVGFVSLWGVLATLFSAWDHARESRLLRKSAGAEIAREPDPKRFWRAHRGLFPYAWN